MVKLNENEKIEELLIDDYKIIQSNSLYRFTSDAVMLSRFASAKKPIDFIDLCSGSGIVGIHFYALNSKMIKSGVLCEMQTALSEMSERSIALNGLEKILKVENIKLQELNEAYNNKFDLVLCNPPYEKQAFLKNDTPFHIAACRAELTVSLEEIIATASRLLKRGGKFCICHKCERLSEIIILFEKYSLSAMRIEVVSGGENKDCYLVLIEAAKGVKPMLKIRSIINNAADMSGK